MKYLASEKLEIIRIVEQSHLPAKQTLDKLVIPRITFYRWYDRYQTDGPEVDLSTYYTRAPHTTRNRRELLCNLNIFDKVS